MRARPLVAGNWKMNGLRAALSEIAAMRAGYDASLQAKVELLVCPPVTLLAAAAWDCQESAVAVGAQNCHIPAEGAHTGEVSAEMLADAGARYVIVGHSERRADHGETDLIVHAKAQAVARAGLIAIVCVGETEAERRSGQTLAIIGSQVARSVPVALSPDQLVVAYEPVWAIGTGLTPTLEDVAEVHGFIRERLADLQGAAGSQVRILYGGSVKPGNAKDLLAVRDVDGALVGGASLRASDFLAIARAYA